ncbi:MAG: DUF2130 domain-containing protein [Sphaerochaetaceae bacterium]|nr:DUF2130 domain-containing protein [Sphaerochaetaceae bacterium]
MKEITCPNCHCTFKMEGSEYAEIIAQIRDEAFENELLSRIQNNVQAKELELNKAHQTELNLKDQQLRKVQDDLQKKLGQTEDNNRRLELEVQSLTEKLKAAIESMSENVNAAVSKASLEKDLEIQKLKSRIENNEMEKRLAVQSKVEEYNSQLSESRNSISLLQQKLQMKDSERDLAVKNAKDSYEEMLRMKDEEIARYKDFKARLSTKLLGESLEQHCQIEFNRLRATAFSNAYFDKDNDASLGSKGDFIFRDFDENQEYISIMFEMKNEMDEEESKSKKHKNEDFFAKLDKDRREKHCEYAVLVSMLEPDNELYNSGIVDVSYKYEKMYVIRPQFFIPIITILRDAARNSISYRKELAAVRTQNIDLERFGEKLEDFKEKFGRNYRLASERFSDAIKEIDKSIAALQKTKDNLINCENNLRLANDKAENLTVKRLTKDSPSLQSQLKGD